MRWKFSVLCGHRASKKRSFSEEEEEEDEDDHYSHMQGSTDVEEFDGQHETFEICVICSKAVGSCVHTKQSAAYAPPATFRSADKVQETTSYTYSSPTEDGLRLESSTHFPSHPNDGEMPPDASPQKMPTDDFEQHSSKETMNRRKKHNRWIAPMAAWANR